MRQRALVDRLDVARAGGTHQRAVGRGIAVGDVGGHGGAHGTIVTPRPRPAGRYFSTWTRLLKSSVHSRQSLRTSTSVAASVERRAVERFAAVGQQQPVAAARERVLAFVGDVDHEQAVRVRQALDDRNQVRGTGW